MKNCYKLLLLFFVLGYILPLNFRPMAAPDEYRYAEIPREMILRGEYAVPKLAGVRYFEKPAFGYQMNAVSFKIFGVNKFALRLPGALCAGLAALLLVYLVRRMTRSDELAALCGGLYLAMGLVYAVGVFAVLDSQLSGFLAGVVICYYLAIQEPICNRRKIILLILSGVFAGLSFITKGFLAFAVPGLVILGYILWQKKYRLLWTTPWIPLIFTALVALPWSLAVHFKEPDYWNYFFWIEHIQRMLSSGGAQHPEPLWFFIPIILVGMLPVAFLLPFVIKGWRGEWREFCRQDFGRLLLCWLVLPFIFFSLSDGKLATYILPCLAPVAVLCAMGLRRYLDKCFNAAHFDRMLRWAALVLAVGALLFAGYHIFVPEKYLLYRSGETLTLITALTAILGFCSMLYAASRTGVKYKMTLLAAGMLFLFIGGNAATPVIALARKNMTPALEYFRATAQPGQTQIITSATMMHAVAYVYGDINFKLFGKGGELSYGLAYPDTKHRRMVDLNELKTMLAVKGRKPVVMIMHNNREKEFVASGVPAADKKMSYDRFTLRRWN